MGRRKNIQALTVVGLIFALVAGGCRQNEQFYSNVLRSDVFYQIYDDQKVDILWVMDNSGSMEPRRRFVRDNLQQFVSLLGNKKAADYQMAFVTTDVFSSNGDLVAAPSGLNVVKSVSSADPIGDAASIINAIADTPTSFWEQGLEAAYQAITKHKDKFSRPGVNLIVIFLSDEDDFSCAQNCFGVEPEHNLNWKAHALKRYIDFFQNVKKVENADFYAFPIVITDPNTCSYASVGTRYMKVAQMLGGLSVSGSVCDSKLSASYQGVAKVIADRSSRFKLSTPSKGTGLNVFVDQDLVPFHPDNYIFDEATNEIVFTGAVPKKGSIISVTYNEITD